MITDQQAHVLMFFCGFQFVMTVFQAVAVAFVADKLGSVLAILRDDAS